MMEIVAKPREIIVAKPSETVAAKSKVEEAKKPLPKIEGRELVHDPFNLS